MKAPVTYDRTFISQGATFLFNVLWRVMPWEQREGAPRREAWFNPYGQPYTYGQGEHARTYQAHSIEGTGAAWGVRTIMEQLNAHTGAAYDCCFVNGYEHGRHSLGWHADDSPEMDMDHPIATVSLGAEREIWFRPRSRSMLAGDMDQPNPEVEKLTLANGSVAIMGAGMQRDWQHRIPKSSVVDCGPRISLTYRRLVR